MSKKGYINVRVEENTKKEVDEILETLGINMSTAINLFLHQVLLKRGLPFDVKIHSNTPNKRAKDLAEALNLTGGKAIPPEFEKILSLYAKGDLDYDTALYAIKRAQSTI